MSRTAAFALAELLICLLILGEIATFTIPKVLQSQQISSHNAKAKEFAGMMSEAYQKYKAANGLSVPTNTSAADLTPYLNYLKVDTTSSVDLRPRFMVVDCSNSAWMCLKLHNGGTLVIDTRYNFGGSSSTNALNFGFDPDSSYCGTTSASTPGQGIEFWMYYNGKLRTAATMENPTARQDGNVYLGAGYDPSWFSWP
jgi:type II secretory pathway pseudopilin PulG